MTEPVVGDVEFVVLADGRIVLAEALLLFDADEYDKERIKFDVWKAR